MAMAFIPGFHEQVHDEMANNIGDTFVMVTGSGMSVTL